MTKRGVLMLVLGMGLSLTGAGCAALGLAAHVLQPPRKVEAQFVPTTRPVAVLVESYRVKAAAGGATLTLRDTLASFVVEELRKHRPEGVVLDSHKVYDLRNRDARAFKAMTIDEIGRKLGVEQVIYVDLIRAGVMESTGGDLVRGEMTAMVRVVDSATGRTLWPTEVQDGRAVGVDTPFTRVDDTTNANTVADGITRATADQIAKMFYTYTVRD